MRYNCVLLYWARKENIADFIPPYISFILSIHTHTCTDFSCFVLSQAKGYSFCLSPGFAHYPL